MNLIKINKPQNIKEYLKNLGVDKSGIEIISKKTDLHFFEIKNLKTPAVNILKQDALSIGAELAVPSGAILCKEESYNCLLIANTKQLEILSKKELAQPFGLKDLANELKNFLQTKKHPLKLMGIINANSDSFYSGSRFLGKEAILKIEKLIEDGADIIDIGAVSSRPGSKPVSKSEELNRISDILSVIKEQKLYEKATFSIDSYTPSVIEKALDGGFSIINDITGAKDEKVIELAIKYKAKLAIMHMQGTPQTMQQNPTYEDVVIEIEEFFKNQIKKCTNLGLNKKDIILDVGIGFGKKLEHNLALLNSMQNFTKFGCEILIGASRKSLIDNIIPTPIEDRLAGTLIIHTKAVERGANIVRCHDVKEHKQAFEVLNRL